MKKILFLTLGLLCVTCLFAQSSQYAGTWIWHYDSPYENGQEGIPPRDEFIRIDIEDGQIFIRLKMIGKDGHGRPMQSRKEAEMGDEKCASTLAYLYKYGIGIESNQQKANQYYNRAINSKIIWDLNFPIAHYDIYLRSLVKGNKLTVQLARLADPVWE